MNKIFLWHVLTRLALGFLTALVAACGGGGGGSSEPPAKKVLILHTNDLHSHLMGHAPEADYSPLSANDDSTVGGFARLAVQVGRERAGAGSTPVLLLDAGDFMMGTPFEALALSAAAELTEMGRMGYDAIGLGNHEFDWTPRALAGIIGAAAAGGFQVPILATNMQYSAASTADDDLQRLETLGFIKRKTVKTLSNGLKVGIFSILGADAAAAAAPLAAPVTFSNQVTTAQAMADELRNVDKVDLVICLSHSGIDEQGKGEDAELAKAVGANGKPAIDVIVSGHTHVALTKPVQVNNTVIVQTGSYGANLGRLELQVPAAAGTPVTVSDYRLVKIDDTIPGDAATQSRIDGYIGAIDNLIAPFKYRMVMSNTAFDMKRTTFSEFGLGDLLADSFRTVTGSIDGPVDVAILANIEIRADVLKGTTGNIWFADAFRVSPNGIGPDSRPGYPLVTYYLDGTDLKGAMEVMAAASDVFRSDDYFLQVSGLNVTYAAASPPFNRVTSIKAGAADVNLSDKTKCYKVVSTIAIASLVAQIPAATGGAVSVRPKQADCATPITDFTTRIVKFPSSAGPQEMKAWLALVQYLAALKTATGAPGVPTVYATAQGRIVRQ